MQPASSALALLACLWLGPLIAAQHGLFDHWGSARALLAPSTSSLTPEACVAQAISDVYSRCTATSSSRQRSIPRDVIVKMLHNCLSGSSSSAARQPMRILMSGSRIATMIQNQTALYSAMTDVPIKMDVVPVPSLASTRIKSQTNAANYSNTHEVWLVGYNNMGDAVNAKYFKDLTDLVLLDSRLKWEGIFPSVRTAVLTYKSTVYTLPMSTYLYHFMYRKDVFDKYNITVPHTWRDMVKFAKERNGTDGMWAFCGGWGPCYNMGTLLFRHMMASMIQTHGAGQGWFFNADDMGINFQTRAASEAIDMLKSLYNVSMPDPATLANGCPSAALPFFNSQCLMTIMHPLNFKTVSHVSRMNNYPKLHGNLGFMPWPGSAQVLDRQSNTMVACNPQICPYSTAYPRSNGSTYWVNHSPSLEATTFALNNFSPSDISFFTFTIMAYLTSQEVNNQMVFDSDSEAFPSRPAQLDWRLWEAAGFNRMDSQRYCADMQFTMGHPNLHYNLRMPGSPAIMTLIGKVVNQAYAGAPTSQVQDLGYNGTVSIIQSIFGDNSDAFRAEYYASINKPMPSPPPAQPPPVVAPPILSLQPQANRNNNRPEVIVPSVVVPICVAGLLAAVAYRYRRFLAVGSKYKRTRHPGPGPETTLCVTDIESSTLLWEELDPLVMDTSVKLHNGCIRNLAAKHKGYESVWEGDSFILAFPNPAIAIEFCMAVQKELLQLPWPSALLQNDHANEVWCCETVNHARSRKSIKMLPSSDSAALHSNTADSEPKPMRSPGATQDLATGSHPPTANRGTQLTSNGSVFGNWDTANTILMTTLLDDTHSSNHTAGEGGGAPAGSWDVLLGSEEPLLQQGSGTGSPKSTPSRRSSLCFRDLGCLWASQWAPCQPTQTGGVLAYKGLRVRLGMHSGVESAANITYNSAMGRYHYTGPVRIISNAVASAGHGGHTLMSGTTAALLDPDATGVLTRLPSDCSVYHQGLHRLKDVQDDTELILVLPNTLRCRLGLQQDALRSLQVTTPGIMMAPVPTAAASDTTALVFMQFSGLEVLLAWNAAEARTAIRQSRSALMEALGEWGGVLSEDGLALALRGQGHRANSLLPVQQSATTVGRVAAAFSTQQAAVAFAVGCRHQLLTLDWTDEILAHELCERVGQLNPEHSTLVQDILASAGSHHAAMHASIQGPSGSGTTPGVMEQCQTDTVSTQPPVSMDGHTTPSASVAGEAEGGRSLKSRSILSVGAMRSAVPKTLRWGELLTGKFSKLSDAAVPARQQEEAKGKRKKTARRTTCLDAPMLRGLRTRTVVLRGRDASLVIDARGSGHAVYHFRDKLVPRLMGKLKPGQILLDNSCFKVSELSYETGPGSNGPLITTLTQKLGSH